MSHQNHYDVIINHRYFHEFRFGGIELASGTKVELENNKVFSNKNLIKKCLDSGECLYKLTSFKYYPIQNHYRCLTCNSSGKSKKLQCGMRAPQSQMIFTSTGQSISSLGKVPIEILPRKRHISWVLADVAFGGRISNRTPGS